MNLCLQAFALVFRYTGFLPKRIFGKEVVVRAIFSPYHFDKNKRKRNYSALLTQELCK